MVTTLSGKHCIMCRTLNHYVVPETNIYVNYASIKTNNRRINLIILLLPVVGTAEVPFGVPLSTKYCSD